MRINNNLMAVNAYRQLGVTNAQGQKALEKLSSGLRINRAADDAAGLAISEKMRGQIRGLNQASRNAQDGISLIQTAEGALNESQSILQRMRELAVQSANDTNTASDRAKIQDEVNELAKELTRIADTTEFNTRKLLDGNFSGTLQIGANEGQNLSVSIGSMDSKALSVYGVATKSLAAGTTGITSVSAPADTTLALGDYKIAVANTATTQTYTLQDSAGTAVTGVTGSLNATTGDIEFKDGAGKVLLSASGSTYADGTATFTLENGGINISSQAAANSAITTINNALESVSSQRSSLGAVQNRLEYTIKNLDTAAENLQAAESRIRDVDMAKEMMEFTRTNILQQAGTAMLAQANAKPQSVLQLLG